jgi:hypothetical protein
MASPDDASAREAQDVLKRVARESETLGASSAARAADSASVQDSSTRRFVDHFTGRDAVGTAEDGGTDPAELWGRRIGRALSLAGVLILIYWLGSQLRLW